MSQINEAYDLIETDGLSSAILKKSAMAATHHEELCIVIGLLDELDQRDPLSIGDLAEFIPFIDNWATSDQLSSIIARAHERNPTQAKPYFKKWNRSQNPWMRRQSLVGLYYYARQRKRHPDEKFVIAQVKALLQDPHFYVQKGVGWTLRELHNVSPKTQESFVKKHLKQISSTAWFAASENYPKELKKKLVLERRQRR